MEMANSVKQNYQPQAYNNAGWLDILSFVSAGWNFMLAE